MANIVQDPRFKSDSIFNDINKYFITLKDNEMREYNVHLRRVLNNLIVHMKRDPLFNACYQRIAYVGSYYEGMKVGKPEEFDLNVIINLPVNYNMLQILTVFDHPGYIIIKSNSDVLINLRKHPRWSEYKVIDSWFDKDVYIDQNKFRQWFESVCVKALGMCEPYQGKYMLMVDEKQYLLSHKKSGPAWTLKIDVPGGHTVDVDLVPVLEFSSPPPKPFKNHKTEKKNWFVISKPLEGLSKNIMWRPSFYEREAGLLKGSTKQVIRQMKKLRDTQNFKSIASYYIKTLFLHEVENHALQFDRMSSTYFFYYMLQKLQAACVKREIYDYWNPENNLLSRISSEEMLNISCRLSKIIKDIDKRIASDPYVLAEYILMREELEKLEMVRLTTSMTSTNIAFDGNGCQ